MGEEAGSAKGKRLATSTSSYLRSAAEQPIDWYPWGPEPFELARRTGRPILLDVGASWCHWCHVMDEGTYADPKVAQLLGESFVAVKVDRDENPEVDRRFQRQVGALTGEGGWPLTAFLTPQGEVFLGGTYFPPTDGHGRPGMRRVLQEVARLWKEEPERIRENTQAIQGALERMRSVRAGGSREAHALLAAVLADVHSSYDPAHGGFGTAPKFPHPTAISLLLWDARANRRALSDERARETLVRMADGGMYDQVGGGFHRYSVDEGWHIPHFEKMGSDNGALLAVYTEGAQRFGDPRFDDVIRGTVGWVRGVLGDPAGGFGSSQDADNAPGDDGGYFTWSRAELKGLLPADEYRFASRFFGVGTDGRMPHDPDQNVLFRMLPPREAAEGLPFAKDPAPVLARIVEQLRAARSLRPAPAVDRALYADINGRFIGAFARAGVVVDDPTVVADARHAADRFLAQGYSEETGVAHRLEGGEGRGRGHLEDQVAFAAGLLELAVALPDPKYLAPAVRLLTLVDREYRGEDGLLRDLAPRFYDGPTVGGLGEPSYPLEDSPHLAANSGAALAFLRLAGLVHEESWREKAAALLAPIGSRVGHSGLFASGAALAAGWCATEPVTVVVEGEGAAAHALLRVAQTTWVPLCAVFAGRPPPPFSFPDDTGGAAPSTARALVCFGNRCLPPVTDPSSLRALLVRGAPTS
ncbi:MAG TPA: thioredoxin domain-containing protein [Thermoplasmata archaeon]|nr:thioredoxin domain-containing protein [Thermoplasmata archaeon]